jgi:hypothetical protein
MEVACSGSRFRGFAGWLAAMEALVRFGVALFDSLGEAAKVRGAGFLSYPCGGLP